MVDCSIRFGSMPNNRHEQATFGGSSERVNERLDELEQRIKSLEDRLDSGDVELEASDLENYLDQVGPDTHVERATAIAKFLVRVENIDPMTIEDIDEAYVDLRIPRPANMSDVLAKAENRKWMMRKGKEGQNVLWTITKPGIEAVERGFKEK